MGKIVAVCSGSGGAGKSTVALSLAIGAAKRGKHTILLDASGASRSCDLLLGFESIVVLDMLDVIKREASIHTALYAVPGKENLKFACASLYEGVCINELSGILLALRAMCDFLVIDLPSGPVQIGEGLLDRGDAVVMLASPDDTSLRALERVIGTLKCRNADQYLVLNRMNVAWVKKGIQYDRSTSEMLLDMPVSAVISENEHIPFGVKKGKSAIEADSRIASEFSALLKDLL